MCEHSIPTGCLLLLLVLLLLLQTWNQAAPGEHDLDAGCQERQQCFQAGMQPWLQRLSVLIIGPGLGDDPCVSADSDYTLVCLQL
jgi:hypothetical protein